MFCLSYPARIKQWLLHLPSPPLRVSRVARRLCLSLRPGLLGGSSLDTARNFGRPRVCKYMCGLFEGRQLLYVCHYWKMLGDRDVEEEY